MSRWVNVSGNLENNKVNVTTPGSSDSVNATNNNAKYYSDLAKEYSESAKISAENSKEAEIWAEGTDDEVQALGGEHSSKRWAELLVEGIGGRWGTIIGDINNQTDLMTALSYKVDYSYLGDLVTGFEESLEDKVGNDSFNTAVGSFSEAIANVEEKIYEKQNLLIAGDNITIKNNVISAKGGDKLYDKITNCILSMPENAISNTIGTTFYLSTDIKALIPNGFNDDGTYNNIEWTNENEIMQNVSFYGDSTHLIYVVEQNVLLHSHFLGSFSEDPEIGGANGTYYNTTENKIYLNRTTHWYPANIVFLAELTATDGVITTFEPKKPVKLVTYDDIKDNVYITETYQNGTSWYRIYSDGWCEQGGQASSDNQVVQIIFLVTYKDTNYTAFAVSTVGGSVANYNSNIGTLTTNGFYFNSMIGKACGCHWEAKGYIR